MNDRLEIRIKGRQPSQISDSAGNVFNRRGFLSSLLFGFLALFVRRSTQAKLAIKHLEGKPIPRALYISQVVGRGRPVYPQDQIRSAKLRSVTK